MTIAGTARVATERGAVYLEQLCEHFADSSERHSDQEFAVTVDDHRGSIDFTPVVSGVCHLDAGEEGVLEIEVRAGDQPALERIQRIVGRHLERFAQGEGLTVEWGPPTERPSTG